jgi:antitoxin ParD1/3/4
VTSLEISLTPDLEKLVLDCVKSGRYASANAVICEALSLLEQRDRDDDEDLSHLKSAVAAGLEHLATGRASLVDEVAVERIKRRGRVKLTGLD